MTSVIYQWAIGFISPANNAVTAGNQQDVTIAANAARTMYMSAWTGPSPGEDVQGRIFYADGTPATSEFTIAGGASYQRDPSLAGLADGRFIAVYEDQQDVRARIYNPDGSLSQSIDIAVGAELQHQADVTALADGGFAVSWTHGNGDVATAVYNTNGTVRHAQRHVAANGHDELNSSIAGLASGGFVVTWQDWAAGHSEIRTRRFDSNGNALDGTDTQGVLIDTWGFNTKAQVAALPDGGYVLAYADDGWGNGIDITMQIYNANGTARNSSSRVNSDLVNGWQGDVRLAVTSDSHFVVNWQGEGNREYVQAYDALGNKLGVNVSLYHDSLGGDLAGLAGSTFAHAWQSPLTDGSGTSAKNVLLEITRDFLGSGGNDTINGFSDAIAEIIQGNAGHDTLTGGAGKNIFVGGLGNDTIVGGPGEDTAKFNMQLRSHILYDFGSKILVWGPEGLDQLSGVEHLRFANDVLDVVNDGSGLFDTLYYLSENQDVYAAGVNALQHFSASGWHEGRNPNAFFNTSAYLAVNKDVAAAGVNPLDHYHTTGWHEGRDPSSDFDTTLYLIHNPDVAAAGVDPLEHFLQFGFAEGRTSHFAVGSVVNGFDAQYYLFHNPDVAAAGVDPLEHFNTMGWHEGRNPNAYFNTEGYLAHYADVAASGANPLQHYEQFGWHEGRDPSAYFDTLKYLATNPDVAAAGVNPLDHFLQNGIYEGRSTMGDGLWH